MTRLSLLVSLTFALAASEHGFALHLENAVAISDDPEVAPHLDLDLQLERIDGAWQRIIGHGYGVGMPEGMVFSVQEDDHRVHLEIGVRCPADAWIPERAVVATVLLTRHEDGGWRGSWRGVSSGRVLEDAAWATNLGPRTIHHNQPVGPRERPRALLRTSDLEPLRKRLATPHGQAFLARVEADPDPIGLGILYQVTGERAYAARAAELYRSLSAKQREVPYSGYHGTGDFGHRQVAWALAWDLCHDAWPDDLRHEIYNIYRHWVPLQLTIAAVTSHANQHPCSNYYGPGMGTPALCTLALTGDEGAQPGSEIAEDLRSTGPITIAPEAIDASTGVPVVDLVAGAVPPAWIALGPLPGATDRDVFAKRGGYRRYRPRLGEELVFTRLEQGRPTRAALAFAELAADAENGIDLDLLLGERARAAATVVAHTVLRAAADTVLAFDPGPGQPQAWLAGTRLETARSYRLSAGTYPLTVIASSQTSAARLAPRLVDPAGEAFAWRRRLAELDDALLADERARWLAQERADPVFATALHRARWRMRAHYRLGIGDGGFQAETGIYARIATWMPMVFASLHRRMYGWDVSRHDDISHLMVRRLMQSEVRDGGGFITQKLNSDTGMSPGWIAANLPVVPADYRPALQWAWHHAIAAEPDGAFGRMGIGGGLDRALRFLHIDPGDPGTHPAERMPLTWRATGFDYMIARNSWQGPDQAIFQAFAKSQRIGGWNHPNAGTFRLRALGHVWVGGSIDRVGMRLHEPVVILPDDLIRQGPVGEIPKRGAVPGGGLGRVTAWEPQDNGSASLVIDLADIYRLPHNDPRHGSMSGRRALAVDYSGASGAPVLLAVADEIYGGGRRIWQWPVVDVGTKGSGEPPAVTLHENGFTLARDDGTSLRATFLHPRKPDLAYDTEPIRVGVPGDGHAHYEGPIPRITATGADHFLVVATVQRGDAPVVTVDGEGLTATASVGAARVAYGEGGLVYERVGDGPNR